MTDVGVALEARVQRLFLAQGIFAERSLWPAADASHRILATDIDVLVSEYSSNFHLTRSHAECKSGKRVAILDRVFWLHGVRAMLGADASYLVLQSFDEDATGFAKNLGVDVMTFKQLESWEQSLYISTAHWPNRSAFELIDPLKQRWLDLGKEKDAPKIDRIVREAIQFVEIDSWHVFGYGSLNRLISILRELSDTTDPLNANGVKGTSARYSASALLVRLSQYLLAICHDVSRVPVSNLHSYLSSRLVFGDQDPERARALIQGTVKWMSQALNDRNIATPPEIDSSRLFQFPGFSEGLIALVQKLLRAPNEAKYLPIAVETEQFGDTGETDLFPSLRFAWTAGHDLVVLVKGFAVASLGIDPSLLTPLRNDLAALSSAGQGNRKKGRTSSISQTKLSLGGS